MQVSGTAAGVTLLVPWDAFTSGDGAIILSKCYVIGAKPQRNDGWLLFYREQTNTNLAESLHLCDVGESNNIRHNADNCDEDLSAFSEDVREFVDERGDEAFNGAELERLHSHVNTALRNTF